MRHIWLNAAVIWSFVLSTGQVYAELNFGLTENLGPPVNTRAGDESPSISADDLSLYFTRNRGSRELIHVATRPTTSSPWSTPVNIGTTVNSGDYQDDASISSDDLTLYYHTDASGRMEIWQVRRDSTAAPWGQPEVLSEPINSEFCNHGPDISSDSLSLYFGRYDCRSLDSMDLFVATRETTTSPWEEPERLSSDVNSPFVDGQPSISSDGLTLFFTSTRPGGFGGGDIYVTTRPTHSNPWGPPVNVGPTVNTWIDELAPEVNADATMLYFYQGEFFTGDRPFDVMQVPLRTTPWRTEVLIPTASEWRFFRGTQEPSPFPQLDWATTTFDDSGWETGQEGFGYAAGELPPFVATELSDMRENYTTLYVRHGFSVDESLDIEALMLDISFADDLIAYVNGVEVARSIGSDTGPPRPFDARSSTQRDIRNTTLVIPLNKHTGLLSTDSDNVLAIQGFNGRPLGSDFSLGELKLVALVPEPSTLLLAAMALMGMLPLLGRQSATSRSRIPRPTERAGAKICDTAPF